MCEISIGKTIATKWYNVPGLATDIDAAIQEEMDRADKLRFFIAESLPFLEEAWKACFHGEETALLSAEERGMGRLLGLFREIAAGKPAMPPGVITASVAGRPRDAGAGSA